MSAVEEYRTGTSDFNRDADSRILSEIAGPAHFVMHLADAAIAELEAELAAMKAALEEVAKRLKANVAGEHAALLMACTHVEAATNALHVQTQRAEQAEAQLSEERMSRQIYYEKWKQAEAELEALRRVAESALAIQDKVAAQQDFTRHLSELAAEARRTGISQTHRIVEQPNVHDYGGVIADLCEQLDRWSKTRKRGAP